MTAASSRLVPLNLGICFRPLCRIVVVCLTVQAKFLRYVYQAQGSAHLSDPLQSKTLHADWSCLEDLRVATLLLQLFSRTSPSGQVAVVGDLCPEPQDPYSGS